ncbi:MAG: putative 6,7-dimethyl-8-ribityllumazine synthase [Piptocephalis tieghemiana]|nr:MAG: putative 6,7-dimethyl-8-ribityllumazine synthase [Piptocephalis tieghemiana]
MTDKTVKGITETTKTLNGKDLRVLVIKTRWNQPIISSLVEGTVHTLKKHGVQEKNIVIEEVPGSYELPFAAKRLIELSRTTVGGGGDLLSSGTPPPSSSSSTKTTSVGPYDAVVCVGVLIKGSTMHFEYICEAVSQGLMRVGLDSGIPVIFGVLTCLTEEQAMQRAGKGEGSHNHGEDWGTAAVEMALLGQPSS